MDTGYLFDAKYFFCYKGLIILILLKQVKKMIIHSMRWLVKDLDQNMRLVNKYKLMCSLDIAFMY